MATNPSKQESASTRRKSPVRVHELGLPGDAIMATEHHGGADQAIYAYSTDDYDWWAAGSRP